MDIGAYEDYKIGHNVDKTKPFCIISNHIVSYISIIFVLMTHL